MQPFYAQFVHCILIYTDIPAPNYGTPVAFAIEEKRESSRVYHASLQVSSLALSLSESLFNCLILFY